MAVIAKYKFNSTLYADLVPEFNAEFTNYTVTDETTETDSEGNVIKTRVIEHDTLLPTLMRFGRIGVNGESTTDNRTDSLLEILDMNTSELTNCNSMFRYNTKLTSISCEWDTSNVTNMYCMFSYCQSLTTLDVSNFNTSNVTTMQNMFYSCDKLTSLDVSNFITNNVTNMNDMFYKCNNLTSLDVSNWGTSNVISMGGMFRNCTNLTLLDVSNFNTSKVTRMDSMFYYCNNLTSLVVSNWDISNVTEMSSMFNNCNNLTSLDLSNWDTSNVTNMGHMFFNCDKLTSLDISNFNTSNVVYMDNIFNSCSNLTSLDLSNFDTSNVTNMSGMFTNIPKLSDIGMLYCSQSTINTLSSNISTPSTNVWVEGSMIDDLTSYNNVTYKAYYWEKEILLNSPLLEGDKIVKKDGKIYHYHKMGMIVLDGSENWSLYSNEDTSTTYIGFRLAKDDVTGVQSQTGIRGTSDKFNFNESYKELREGLKEGLYCGYNAIVIGLKRTKLFTQNVQGFKQWLSENPTTVVYELANPYYELISDTSDDLSLSLLSENNIISNNSLIPTNMNVKNNGMSTVAMNTSTKYTVAFDKDTDSSVTIDLCGSTIDTTDNVVEITTPSELANDEITFIGDCEVSNVRILEGSVSGDAIPKESFEGLKSSFEDGYIPNNLITDTEYTLCNIPNNIQVGKSSYPSLYIKGDNRIRTNLIPIKPNTTYTAYTPLSELVVHQFGIDNLATISTNWTGSNTYSFTTNSNTTGVVVYARGGNDNPSLENRIDEFNPVLLEGDWTHLTEEDFNNLGKYKVEYKVVGKNKFDNSLELYNTASNYVTWEFINDGYKLTTAVSSVPRVCNHSEFNVEKGKSYIVSANINVCSGTLGTAGLRVAKINADGTMGATIMYLSKNSNASFTPDGTYDKIAIQLYGCSHEGTTEIAVIEYTDIQLEEGTVVTEYEPYKEYTKTFYLNSPLLEGDTIEDVNGVATHVKRYGKVILDGSEDEVLGASSLNSQTSHTTRFYFNFNANKVYPPARILTQNESPIILTDSVFSDNFGVSRVTITGSNNDTVVHRLISLMHTNSELRFVLPSSELSVRDLSGFRQWLQANPMTVVYQLASPIYEPISTESILCDSYVNGHLDVDTNIPVEKVMFNETPYRSLTYLENNTNYTIQFESDNKGHLDWLNIKNSSGVRDVDIIKGVNKFNLTTGNESSLLRLFIAGIGFNASNIQVVATDRDNIGYFKGIQSSFEDKVIRNKNLFNKNNIVLNYGFGSDGSIINPSSIEHSTEYIECKPNTSYICNFGTGIHYFDENKTWISYQNHGTSSPSNAKYLVKCIGQTVDLNTVQIEEGIESTTYEEYNIYNGKYEVKVTLEDENGVISNEFIYLNSPLLKGDRIEMYNGKLCHYHKMRSVVLDGGEDWEVYSSGMNEGYIRFRSNLLIGKFNVGNFNPINTHFANYNSTYLQGGLEMMWLHNTNQYLNVIISDKKLIDKTSNGFKQWLQANPTTVVYELAEPYYEDITPIQNEFVITSIGESSFTIDSGAIPTDGEITYSVNVKLLNDLEESINNNTSSTDTDLSTILDDIINE